jgi:hypothetical protein
MTDIQQPIEPTPGTFGISEERVKHFRRILEDDPMTIAAFGIPIAAIVVIGVNYVLPEFIVSSPFWRFVLPLIAAFYLIGAIQQRRKANALREKDYAQFGDYQSALQNYRNAMKTYAGIQRQARYQEIRKRREKERQIRLERQAKWRQLDGREFEIEVVKVLFSKGYEVECQG